jgi:CHAT domain-containing protein
MSHSTDYRVIHFATQAFLDSRNPELSGLVLTMVDRTGQQRDPASYPEILVVQHLAQFLDDRWIGGANHS